MELSEREFSQSSERLDEFRKLFRLLEDKRPILACLLVLQDSAYNAMHHPASQEEEN